MPFNLTNSVSADGDIAVREYKSQTGLTLIVCQVPGPIVHGYIIVPTEVHDDLGIPHTLEHLCFLGSEDYPYKGVLDMLANRCLASGTNAWTDTDHTAYTISTAGPNGFLNILPIYLDHILYPTLTDEAYVTEVHHVNGKGEDGGVVYCEMQGRENNGESVLYREFLRAMYPGHCGYKSETGGILKDIRQSLTNEKIRQYHASFYRPENICITVCGSVKDEDVISVLEKYESKIISKNRQEPFIRPWQSPVPPLEATVVKTLEYPCDDDESGMLWIGWRGPSCVTNFQDTISLGLLTDYLSDNAVSPLQQKFVEVDDPYCAEISCSLIENSESCIFFSFDSTCMKKVKNIGNELLELLKSIASSPASIDMERMKSVIHRKKMQLLSSLESRPHSHVSSSVIGAFLYAQEPSHLAVRLTQIPFYDEAVTKDAHYWCSLITKYFLSQPYVLVIGEPSPSEQKKIAQEEKDRIAAQIASLGEAGLQEKAKILENATSVCGVAPPAEVLTSVPVASTENVSYHTVKQLNTDNHTELSLSPIPYKFQIDDVNSNFVRISVYMNTTSEASEVTDFDLKLRPYLTLMYSLLAESAIDREGTIIPYQDVINQIDSDTISCGPGFGICGRFSQLFAVRMKLEMDKYVKGINWLREIIFQTVFEEERISVVLKKLLSELNTKKRKASLVCHSLIHTMTYDSRCNDYVFAVHQQIKFLSALSKKLKSDPAAVINDLNTVRSFITQSENITIHMVCNQAKVAQANGNIDLHAPWIDVFVPKQVRQASLARVTRPIALAKHLFNVPQSADANGVIAGLGSVDSAYLETRMMYSTSPTDPDLPALLVLAEYLSQLEGPLWRQIRGNGLAYACYICLNVQENSVHFSLYRSSNIHQAYQLSKEVVGQHLTSDDAWDEAKLEASRAALMFSLISKEKSLDAAADESLIAHILNLDANHTRNLIAKISKVTLADVIKVAPAFLSDLFNDNKICKSVVCNTSSVDETMKKFTDLGVTLAKFDLESEINLDSKL